jgi:hypothetical protein
VTLCAILQLLHCMLSRDKEHRYYLFASLALASICPSQIRSFIHPSSYTTLETTTQQQHHLYPPPTSRNTTTYVPRYYNIIDTPMLHTVDDDLNIVLDRR